MYATYETSGRRSATRRTWLAAGGALAAVLVLLILVAAACNARSNQNDPLAGAIDSSPTAAAAEPASGGSAGENTGQTGEAPQDGGDQGQPPAGDGGEEPPPDDGDGEDPPPDDGEEDEPQEMSIEVTTFGPPPTATCHATGKIAVVGGDKQVTVTYRWYRMDLPPHHPAIPQLPIPVAFEEKTLPIPPASEITVKSPEFPKAEAHNIVWLVVTIPQQVVGQQVKYDKCSELGFGPNG